MGLIPFLSPIRLSNRMSFIDREGVELGLASLVRQKLCEGGVTFNDVGQVRKLLSSADLELLDDILKVYPEAAESSAVKSFRERGISSGKEAFLAWANLFFRVAICGKDVEMKKEYSRVLSRLNVLPAQDTIGTGVAALTEHVTRRIENAKAERVGENVLDAAHDPPDLDKMACVANHVADFNAFCAASVENREAGVEAAEALTTTCQINAHAAAQLATKFTQRA